MVIRRQRTRELYSDAKTFDPYYDGCTYVSLEDAMLTQKDVGSEQFVRMAWNADDSIREDNVQLVKKKLAKEYIYVSELRHGWIWDNLPHVIS